MLHRIIKFPKTYNILLWTYKGHRTLITKMEHNTSVPFPCECAEIKYLKKDITRLNYVITYTLCFSMLNSITLFSVVTTKTF